MELHFERTDSLDKNFIELVKQLDMDLAIRDGADHAFYSQFNKIDKLKNVIVAYLEAEPVGCGAFRDYDERTVEVKRMFVPPVVRGKGIASAVLKQLEEWARQLGYERAVLETGKLQPEAISLYKKSGYTTIPNYGQYIGVDNSVCFEKRL